MDPLIIQPNTPPIVAEKYGVKRMYSGLTWRPSRIMVLHAATVPSTRNMDRLIIQPSTPPVGAEKYGVKRIYLWLTW